ncbi:MAG: hypothetical protein LBB08_01035 [Rickettsiales bacterium]|jgi:hypothetical protein|nr:hypothetical protein [Rickettsiales bacterium]
MKKIWLMLAAALGACTYNKEVNFERFYGNADITKVDWSKVDGRGSSCQTNWLFGLLPAGNNSVASAVESAELSKVAFVNTDWTLYLPLLMTRECTNVWGELTPSARKARSHDSFYESEDKAPKKAEKSEQKKSDYEAPDEEKPQ